MVTTGRACERCGRPAGRALAATRCRECLIRNYKAGILIRHIRAGKRISDAEALRLAANALRMRDPDVKIERWATYNSDAQFEGMYRGRRAARSSAGARGWGWSG